MALAFRKNGHRLASTIFKTGAPVIYMKNMPEEFLVNGSRGQVIGFAVKGEWGQYRPIGSISVLVSDLLLFVSDRRRPDTTLLPENTTEERQTILDNPDAYPVVRFIDVVGDVTFVHVTPVQFTINNPDGSQKCSSSMVPLLCERFSASRSNTSSLTVNLIYRSSGMGYLYAQVSGSK